MAGKLINCIVGWFLKFNLCGIFFIGNNFFWNFWKWRIGLKGVLEYEVENNLVGGESISMGFSFLNLVQKLKELLLSVDYKFISYSIMFKISRLVLMSSFHYFSIIMVQYFVTRGSWLKILAFKICGGKII